MTISPTPIETQVVNGLIQARRLVKGGWTQGVMHDVVTGCYCAYGALLAGFDLIDPEGKELPHVAGFTIAHGYLRLATADETHSPQGVVHFNDQPTRTKQEVLDLFDRAIQLASAQGAQ